MEYRYVNYDLEQVKKDYDEISKILFEMQMKLDELRLWFLRFPLFVIHTLFSVAGSDNSTFSQNSLQKTCAPGLEHCMRKYGYMHVF